jgi:hypothetical protein
MASRTTVFLFSRETVRSFAVGLLRALQSRKIVTFPQFPQFPLPVFEGAAADPVTRGPGAPLLTGPAEWACAVSAARDGQSDERCIERQRQRATQQINNITLVRIINN